MEAELHRAEAWKPTQFGVPDDLLAGVKRWPPADVAPAPVVKPASAHKGECVLRDLHGRKLRVLEMINVSVPFRMAIHPPSVDPMARDMVRDGWTRPCTSSVCVRHPPETEENRERTERVL